MPYSVRCTCGKSHEVSSTQAGTEFACACGATVVVPLLSQLRVSAGQEAYESSIVDKILRLKSEKKLPLGDTCLLSGQRTEDTAVLRVQCERSHSAVDGAGLTKGDKILAFLGFWLCWWVGVLILAARLTQRREKAEHQWVGHDLEVALPIRVHRDLREDLQKISNQKRLRELLRTVPLYAQLLDEYPAATIWPA